MWWNIRTSFDENSFVTASNLDPRKPTIIKVKESKELIMLRPTH